MNDLELTNFVAGWNWFLFGVFLLAIVFRVVPSDFISWLGLALVFAIAIGAGVTGALLGGARRKRGQQ